MDKKYHLGKVGSNMDFKTAQDYLSSLVSYENLNRIYYNQDDLNLEKIRKALKDLDLDYAKLKYIHVAGSKGKGTTARIINNYLLSLNKKVGLYTSPHLVDICERILVNGRKITKGNFAKGIFEIQKYVALSGNKLTYFEILTVLALKLFLQRKVEYVILEAGVGGRLDATNIVKPLVAVLTKIEREHLELLGGSLGKIVDEKLGIRKKGVPLVIGKQSAEVTSLIKKRLLNNEECFFVQDYGEEFVFEDAAFQKNANLSYLVLMTLLGKVENAKFNEILGKLKIAGHFDVKKIGNRTVVFDVAHTPASMDNFVHLLQKRFAKKRFVFLIALMKDKDINGILKIVAEVAERVFFSNAHSLRGELPKNLAKSIRAFGLKEICSIEDVDCAYKQSYASLKEDEVLVVTGSHFLIGALYRNLKLSL